MAEPEVWFRKELTMTLPAWRSSKFGASKTWRSWLEQALLSLTLREEFRGRRIKRIKGIMSIEKEAGGLLKGGVR